jgi:hypothetical protein
VKATQTRLQEENDMRTDLTMLRALALSVSLLASGATTALADSPGYYFQDPWNQTYQNFQATPPVRAFAAQQKRGDAADANKAAATKVEDGHFCRDDSSRSVGG